MSKIDKLVLRIEKNYWVKKWAVIIDIWEEIEKLSSKDLENLKNSLSEKGRDFLENIILK